MTEFTQGRKVVVVLGPGRSGTSLAMQALDKLGIHVSNNVIPPNVSNPKGFNEDASIVEIQKVLLKKLAPTLSMPLPNEWLNVPEVKEAEKKLMELVRRELEVAGNEMWAFKDPRTATFLPLWVRIFNQLKIVPRFVLAIRDPTAIIHSFIQQYGSDQAFAELIYLQRTLDALHYTGGDCHLLRYENWFTCPQETFQELADFVFDKSPDYLDVKPPVVDQLDRSRNTYIELHNPMVRRLCTALDDYSNQTIDRITLMESIQEQRTLLNSFYPWWKFAGNLRHQKDKLQQQLLRKDKQLEDYELHQNRLERQKAVAGELWLVVSAYERLNIDQ